jgi:hypothetical protein
MTMILISYKNIKCSASAARDCLSLSLSLSIFDDDDDDAAAATTTADGAATDPFAASDDEEEDDAAT